MGALGAGDALLCDELSVFEVVLAAAVEFESDEPDSLDLTAFAGFASRLSVR
jgi:hypothetical protein